MADDINAKVNIETDKGVRNLEELRDASQVAGTELQELNDQDVSPNIELDVDTTKIKSAGDALDDVGRKGKGMADGVGFGNNALRDLTGPLGDATGSAGDVGDAFEGLGDIVGGIGGKLGLGEEAIGKLSGAVAGIGVVVAAGVAAWSLYKKSQEDAAKATKVLHDAQVELQDGNAEGAAKLLAEENKGLIDTLVKLGVTVDDIGLTLIGEGTVLDDLRARYDAMTPSITAADQARARGRGGIDANIEALTSEHQLLGDTINDLAGVTTGFQEQGAAVAAQNAVVATLTGVLEGAATSGNKAAASVKSISDNFLTLKDQLTEADFVEQLADAFDAVDDAAIAAWDSAKAGAPDAERKMRDYQQSIRDATRLAAELGLELDGIPPETQAKIVATVARGEIDEARRLLEDAAKGIPVTYEIDFADLDKKAAVARARAGGSSGAGSAATPRAPQPGDVGYSGRESFGVTNVYLPPAVSPYAVERAQRDYRRATGYS